MSKLEFYGEIKQVDEYFVIVIPSTQIATVRAFEGQQKKVIVEL
jgi:hypothetical protein